MLEWAYHSVWWSMRLRTAAAAAGGGAIASLDDTV